MPHTEPTQTPPDASGPNDEEPGVPDLFPAAGNFNAVVPLSEIDTDSEPRAAAPAFVPLPKSPSTRAAAKARAQDETEEATLVPTRAARASKPSRTAARRPSWPAMITALVLSLVAGLAAGVYLIKSIRPVAIQSPASMTEDAAHDAAASAENGDSQPTQVASDSRPESKPQAGASEATPQAETSHASVASDVDVRDEKTSRGLPSPKRVTDTETSSSRGERVPEATPAKASVAERTPERPARKAPPSTTNTPATPEVVRTRRATSAAERAPVQRAPGRSLPVSPPPSSAKSKRVIQWP